MSEWVLIVLGLLGQFFVAGAIYGAMRGDLKSLHEKVLGAHLEADRAHKRIDLILSRGVHG